MAQRQAVFLGEPRQPFARAARKFDIGRERHRLDYRHEVRQAVTSFQMRAGIVANEIEGGADRSRADNGPDHRHRSNTDPAGLLITASMTARSPEGNGAS